MPQPFDDVLRTCERVLALSGVYQRGGRLVWINQSPTQSDGDWEFCGPRIEPIHPLALIGRLTEACRFVQTTKKGGEIERLPTASVTNCLFNQKRFKHLQNLSGLQCQPLLRPNGDVLSRPGYDVESGRFVILNDSFGDVMDSSNAVTLLTELLHQFPLDGNYAAVIAYFLTIACRGTIQGQVPCFVFDGNRPGVGKGLLARIGVIIGEGVAPPAYPGFPSNEELRKLLTSVAMQGASHLLFDNVSGLFGGPVLEAALTSGTITDRLLSKNDQVTLPFRSTVVCTSNGYQPTSDMVRRSITIELDSDNPTPHLRDDFEIDDLEAHVRDERPLFLMAAISIVSQHLKAGCPSHGLKPIGSFSDWDRIIRAAVVNAGLGDPCASLISQSQQVSSDEPSDVVDLLRDWCKFDEPLTVSDGLKLAKANPHHFSGISKLTDSGATAHSIGTMFRQSLGRVVEGMSITVIRHTGRPNQYSVEGGK